MSGNCQTLVRSSIHQIPGFKPAIDIFVVDVVLLLDVNDKQYVLMSCHCQTIVCFMHQRSEMRSTKRVRVGHWPVCLPNASACQSARSRS